MGLNLSPSSMLLSVVFSSIGVGYFIYGKKQSRPLILIVGILLMGYTLFISDATLVIAIGVGLTLLPWIVRKFQGY